MIEFPQNAVFGKKIPLVQLKEKGASAKFIKWVKSVKWAYKLSPGTIHLAATRSVKEIEVLDIVLREEGECIRNQALALEVLSQMIPNPCIFRLFNENADFLESVIVPKVSGGALYGDSPLYRLCRGKGKLSQEIVSGVTTLESALVHWSALLAGMSIISGEKLNDFIVRHYQVESLRSRVADIKKKIAKEKQLDRKYELTKEKCQLEKEMKTWTK